MFAYKRRILLAVVGLSPQIVTETLYALVQAHDRQQAFIPTEIHLITTEIGAGLVNDALLSPATGHYHQLLRDYPRLGKPKFSMDNVHIIRDEKNKPLIDIRSIADNTSVADAITTLMAKLTQDPDSALHVSIAGGRKTMGFYLGYIFSLFARPQDQLSHVLVNPPFENHPEFYFPPKKPKTINTHDGQTISTEQAKIELAKIPVVKLRYVQPDKLFDSQQKFSELIEKIQSSHEPPHLSLKLKTREIICGTLTFSLPPALFSWLLMWAKRKKNNLPPINWRELNANEFLAIYAKVVGIKSASYENTKKRLAHGMERDFFRQNNSKLKRALERKLGPAAEHYVLQSLGSRPLTKYELTLSASEISIS